jgi:F-type H+-transporting ATPase subunit b
MAGRRLVKWRWPRAALIAATVALAAGAAAAAEEGKAPYPGDLGQAIAAMVIFLLLLAVLGRWAWKPVVLQLQMREKRIADVIAGAQAREKEAQELLEEHRRRLDRAEADAQGVLERSRQEAAEVRERILAEAREESRRSGDKARQEIDEAKRAALRELYDATAVLATDIASRIIRKNLNPEDHRRLLAESLSDLEQRVAGK